MGGGKQDKSHIFWTGYWGYVWEVMEHLLPSFSLALCALAIRVLLNQCPLY
jgi:hypothetical protein